MKIYSKSLLLGAGLSFCTLHVEANSVTYLSHELYDKNKVYFPVGEPAPHLGQDYINFSGSSLLNGFLKFLQLGPVLKGGTLEDPITVSFSTKVEASPDSSKPHFGFTDGKGFVGFYLSTKKNFYPIVYCEDKLEVYQSCEKLDPIKDYVFAPGGHSQILEVSAEVTMKNSGTDVTAWVNGMRYDFSSDYVMDRLGTVSYSMSGSNSIRLYDVTVESDFLRSTSEMFESGPSVPLECVEYAY